MEVIPAETELFRRHLAGGGGPRHFGPPLVQVQKYCKVRVAFSVCREHLWCRSFASNFYVLTSPFLVKSFNTPLALSLSLLLVFSILNLDEKFKCKNNRARKKLEHLPRNSYL